MQQFTQAKKNSLRLASSSPYKCLDESPPEPDKPFFYMNINTLFFLKVEINITMCLAKNVRPLSVVQRFYTLQITYFFIEKSLRRDHQGGKLLGQINIKECIFLSNVFYCG